MISIIRRHPRYGALLAFAFCMTCLFLALPATFKDAELTLQNRIKRSSQIYEKVAEDRKNLVKRLGPEPGDIALFPPDVAPWPPYTVWDFFPAAFNCPHEVERLGVMGDGGKWVCGLSRVAEKEDCVVYSFGINHESSFEAAILEKTSYCRIWGYDFSVLSFGPEIHGAHLDRVSFEAVGLAGEDTIEPENGPVMYSLQTLMARNGHRHIDLLKIDIEGWEFETLEALTRSFTNSPLPFGQLQLEIHLWNKTFAQFLAWWEKLEDAGLRPFWTEPNLVYQNYDPQHTRTADLAEYSFLNIEGSNYFIQPRKAFSSYLASNI